MEVDRMKMSPDETLAERIVAKLNEQKLITEKKLEKLKKDYATGSVSIEDWVILAESERKEGIPHDQKN